MTGRRRGARLAGAGGAFACEWPGKGWIARLGPVWHRAGSAGWARKGPPVRGCERGFVSGRLCPGVAPVWPDAGSGAVGVATAWSPCPVLGAGLMFGRRAFPRRVRGAGAVGEGV